MNTIAKARRAFQKTGSFSVSAAKTGVNRNTLKTWARRYGWVQNEGRKVKPKVKPLPAIKGQWMQSMHHDQAHFLLLDGKTGCSGGANGAKITPGALWFPWDGCLRQCNRCMPHAT